MKNSPSNRKVPKLNLILRSRKISPLTILIPNKVILQILIRKNLVLKIASLKKTVSQMSQPATVLTRQKIKRRKKVTVASSLLNLRIKVRKTAKRILTTSKAMLLTRGNLGQTVNLVRQRIHLVQEARATRSFRNSRSWLICVANRNNKALARPKS